MSTNTLEQLKHAQSSLLAERKPVSQIQGALKQAKDITQFAIHSRILNIGFRFRFRFLIALGLLFGRE